MISYKGTNVCIMRYFRDTFESMCRWARPSSYHFPPASSALSYAPCYYKSKRDLLQKQKRPTTEAKETYYRSKRDLLQKQKRHTTEAKETHYRSKRDLLQKQKRPTTGFPSGFFCSFLRSFFSELFRLGLFSIRDALVGGLGEVGRPSLCSAALSFFSSFFFLRVKIAM